MKTLIIFLLATFISNNFLSQEWKKFHRSDLGLSNLMTRSDYSTGGRHFRINPYDNSLWMGYDFTVQTISSEGVPSFFRMTNTPVFQSSANWVTFEFLPDKVFALDEYHGLFLYENDTWSHSYSPSNFTNGMTINEDTLYILRNNNPMVKWSNENLNYLFNAGTLSRIVVKEKNYWLSSGYSNTSNLIIFDEGGNNTWYDPDTSMIMDTRSYDFKFSPHHDTLYVAGNKGLSLLHNLTFFDSIAPDNTTNMPSGVILDFEFDASDNIWALFGSDAQTPTSIAHYDQQSKNWDMYYDAGNSDINFSLYCSIEMDTLGNLWMVNQNYIHVLELGNLPVWLSSKQPSFQPNIAVYPNPVTELFQIDTDTHILEIYLTDQLGKRIKVLDPNQKEFSVAELSSGIYFVEFVSEGGVKSNAKLIKN